MRLTYIAHKLLIQILQEFVRNADLNTPQSKFGFVNDFELTLNPHPKNCDSIGYRILFHKQPVLFHPLN